MHLDESIEITAVANDSPNPAFVWMPKGTHSIGAKTLSGEGFGGDIVCDQEGFDTIKSSFDELIASGFRVWIDLDHDDGAAAAWVKDFAWSDKLGIIAHVDWTPLGESALRNKEFHSFSPTFRINRSTGRLNGLVPGHAAGGLVNAPAIRTMPSLIAAGHREPSPAEVFFSTVALHDMPSALEGIKAAFDGIDRDRENFEVRAETAHRLLAALENNPAYAQSTSKITLIYDN